MSRWERKGDDDDDDDDVDEDDDEGDDEAVWLQRPHEGTRRARSACIC